MSRGFEYPEFQSSSAECSCLKLRCRFGWGASSLLQSNCATIFYYYGRKINDYELEERREIKHKNGDFRTLKTAGNVPRKRRFLCHARAPRARIDSCGNRC